MNRVICCKGYKKNSHFYHYNDGLHYYYNNSNATTIYFKCVKYDSIRCTGRALLRENGTFRHTKPHNHPREPHFVEERQLIHNVLERCRNLEYMSFEQILDQEKRNVRFSREARSRLTVPRLRTSMRKARLSRYPPIPQTLQGLTRILQSRRYRSISMSLDGRDNLYRGSVTARDGSHSILLTTQRLLSVLEEMETVHGDGTFKWCPLQGTQIFSLVCTWRYHVLPLAWVIMDSKTREAYRAVFQLIKNLIPDFNPSRIISDFELSQQQAWELEFQNAVLQGCLWHLAKAFLRKAKKLELFPWMQALPEVKAIIRECCGLSLLPEHLINMGFEIIGMEALQLGHALYLIVRPFLGYVNDHWVNDADRRRWMSVHGSYHRTNNACESHNNVFRKEHHPNIYKVIEIMARIEETTLLDLMTLLDGRKASRARRVSAVRNDERIIELERDSANPPRGLRATVRNFLHTASYVINGVFDEALDVYL